MSTSPPPDQISLAIIGGGIGGLTLAASLLPYQPQISVHVYEAAQAFSEIGAGVGFGPNALRAMKMMNPAIWEGYKRCETTFGNVEERKRFFCFRYGMRVEENGVDVEDKKIDVGIVNGDGGLYRNGNNASRMKEDELIADTRSDSETSSVHRARFLAELVDLMPPGTTSVRKRLVAIDELADEEGGGVVLRFADGTCARHDAVIGCDGVKSVVRKILLGEDDEACEPVFSGKYCYRGLVDAEKAIEVLGERMAMDSQMYLGQGGHVLTTAITQGTQINIVATSTSPSVFDERLARSRQMSI